MHPSSFRSISVLTIIILSAFTAACGGGGESKAPAPPPSDPPIGDPPPALTFTVGGSISGLTGTLLLQDNRGDERSLTTNGDFILARPFNDGSAYSVAIKTQPADQTCAVANPSGTVSGRNVTTVNITCTTNSQSTFSIGGHLTGAHGTVVLANSSNSGAFETLSVAENGPFTFPTRVVSGTGYLITLQSAPDDQQCTLANNLGKVGAADVTSIVVTCIDVPPTPVFSIGGTVEGLTGTLVVTRISGAAPAEDLAINANGAFRFATPLPSNASYEIAVRTQPANQLCNLRNASGTVDQADVTRVEIVCQPTFAVEGTVTGLVGKNLVLQLNEGEEIGVTPDGHFAFQKRLISAADYDVTISLQPLDPVQTCTVVNGSGKATENGVDTITVNCATEYPRLAISTNEGTNDLSILTVDAESGQLRYHSSAPSELDPIAFAVHPSGEFAYALNFENLNSGSVSSFRIESDGTLSALPGGAVAAGFFVSDIVINPAGTFAYVVNAPGIRLFSIDAGQLRFVEDISLPGSVLGMLLFEPTGKTAYLAHGNHLSALSVAPNGRLTLVQDIQRGGDILTLELSGQYVYALQGALLSGYKIGPDGRLEANGRIMGLAANGPSALDPSGRFLYFISGPNVAGAEIDRRSGSPVGTLNTWRVAADDSTFLANLTVDPTGRFLFVTEIFGNDEGDARVDTFRVDPDNGELTKISVVVNRSVPIAMTLVKGATPLRHVPRFAHTLSADQNTVSTYRIDADSGAVDANGTATGIAPKSRDIATDVPGRRLYVVSEADAGPGGVSAYQIEAGGELTFRNAIEQTPGFRVAVDPAGRSAFVTGPETDIQSFGIAADGTLAQPGALIATGDHPSALALDPAGRFAYVVNADVGDNVVVHRTRFDGSLDPGLPVRRYQAGLQPVSIAMAPSGQHLYVANAGARSVSAFAIAFDGALEPRTGGATAPDGTPTSLVVDALGRFVYAISVGDVAAANGDTQISQFRIKDDGSLEDNGVYALTLSDAKALLKADPSGRFIYVVLGSEQLLTLEIDPDTGGLREISSVQVQGADSLSISGTLQ